eukprot:COSAG05_NODE_1857_length_3950_cov_11.680083_4_plen_72_part_00
MGWLHLLLNRVVTTRVGLPADAARAVLEDEEEMLHVVKSEVRGSSTFHSYARRPVLSLELSLCLFLLFFWV